MSAKHTAELESNIAAVESANSTTYCATNQAADFITFQPPFIPTDYPAIKTANVATFKPTV